MATSPNFNWPEPDNTDLVKNGALAIRTAVDAIDSSMGDLKGGTTGQVLAKASNTDMDFVWSADAAGISPTIVNAKGDIIGASANDTPAITSVGADGSTLVADSSASTGLKWARSGNFTGCRVYASSPQTISNNTDTKIAFPNETFDTDGFHSNVTNNTRITIPAGLSGYYRVTVNLGWASNAAGRRLFGIALNGGGDISKVELTPAASVEPAGSLTDIYPLSAGDYLEVNVYQTSGANLNTSGNSTRDFFELQRIGS